MTEVLTKRKMTLKHKAAISAARTGQRLSEEHKEKLRNIAIAKGCLNTGRTHFKKGVHPHNYKGGISKTREYRNHYNSRYKRQRKGIEGSHSLYEWQALKEQYGFKCACCKKPEPEIKLTKDHILPVSKGGNDNIENIQPLCSSCNGRKHAKIIEKYHG